MSLKDRLFGPSNEDAVQSARIMESYYGSLIKQQNKIIEVNRPYAEKFTDMGEIEKATPYWNKIDAANKKIKFYQSEIEAYQRAEIVLEENELESEDMKNEKYIVMKGLKNVKKKASKKGKVTEDIEKILDKIDRSHERNIYAQGSISSNYRILSDGARELMEEYTTKSIARKEATKNIRKEIDEDISRLEQGLASASG